MSEKEPSKTVRVAWNVPPDFPVQYATNLVVQHTEHDFTITFFDIRPPVVMGSSADKERQLESIDVLHAMPLARIVIAASRMHQFVQVLQDNLATFQQALAEAVEARAKRP